MEKSYFMKTCRLVLTACICLISTNILPLLAKNGISSNTIYPIEKDIVSAIVIQLSQNNIATHRRVNFIFLIFCGLKNKIVLMWILLYIYVCIFFNKIEKTKNTPLD